MSESAIDPVMPCPLKWVEVECFGEDDRPAAGLRYLLTLTDGATFTGELDARGMARINVGAKEASGTLSFPDLDADAWEPIEAGAAGREDL